MTATMKYEMFSAPLNAGIASKSLETLRDFLYTLKDEGRTGEFSVVFRFMSDTGGASGVLFRGNVEDLQEKYRQSTHFSLGLWEFRTDMIWVWDQCAEVAEES